MDDPAKSQPQGADMCLGIPGRITQVWAEDGAPMAHADFAGQTRRVCLAYLPDLAVGDFVITHMGYALTRLSEEDAAATLALMREYGVLDTLDVPERPGQRPAETGNAA
jgi:hydrogenase expression/formation protein HypC